MNKTQLVATLVLLLVVACAVIIPILRRSRCSTLHLHQVQTIEAKVPTGVFFKLPFVLGCAQLLSPDANSVVLEGESEKEGFIDLWVMSLSDGSVQRLTQQGSKVGFSRVEWCPTKDWVTFSRWGAGIYIVDLRNREVAQLGKEEEAQLDDKPIWSPDSSFIIYRRTDAASLQDYLWMWRVKDATNLMLSRVVVTGLSPHQLAAGGKYVIFMGPSDTRRDIRPHSPIPPQLRPQQIGNLWTVDVSSGAHKKISADLNVMFFAASSNSTHVLLLTAPDKPVPSQRIPVDLWIADAETGKLRRAQTDGSVDVHFPIVWSRDGAYAILPLKTDQTTSLGVVDVAKAHMTKLPTTYPALKLQPVGFSQHQTKLLCWDAQAQSVVVFDLGAIWQKVRRTQPAQDH